MVDKKLADWISSKGAQGYTEEQLRDFLAKKKYRKKDIDEMLSAARSKIRPTAQTSEPQANNDFNLLGKLKYLFSSPSTFFENIKGESAAIALGVFATASLLSNILSILVSFTTPYFGFFGGLGLFSLSRSFSYWGGIWLSPLISTILSLTIAFIFAGMIHLLVKAFKGEGKTTDTFKVYAYSMIPYFIISIIPLIGFLSIIYSLILMIIGISKVHNISMGKAATACLLPVIFVIGLLVIGVFAILYNFRVLY